MENINCKLENGGLQIVFIDKISRKIALFLIPQQGGRTSGFEKFVVARTERRT